MKKFQLKLRSINKKDFLGKAAQETDAEHLFSEPGVYELNGKPTVIYGKLSEKYEKMLWVLNSMRWDMAQSNAKKTLIGFQTKNFGFATRRVMRDYCQPAAFALNDPEKHGVICEFGRLLDSIYSKFAPETAERHSQLLQRVRAEWIIPGTRFTSGIINNSNSLPYHYDRGNFEGVFSCMVVFRNLCEGGNLSIPEINAKFLIEDNSFVLFDGQALLHGVTPIKRLNKFSYRYSLVYYSRAGMCKCGTPEEEMVRIRKVKRVREIKRVK